MPTSRQGERTTSTASAGTPFLLGFVALTGIGLTIVSPHVLLVAVLDAASAAIIVVPPMLVGLWLVPFFRFGRLPLRWHLLLGATLGLGMTSQLVLLLGLAGVFQRPVWIGILGLFMALGIIRLRGLLAMAANATDNDQRDDQQGQAGASPWLWWILVPFLILALLAAANAPGFIWAEEGHGYDVLEYHLEMPKEYLKAGRIAYAPHNVYANFPMNVEMLYLLAMIVHHEVYDIGTTANMIHLILGVLAVFAMWVAGREWSPMAGQVSAIAMGTVGWLGFLSGLAYVELGLLFFSAVAVAAVIRATAQPTYGVSLKWHVLSGICSGFACGCKYTAIPFTVIALSIVIFLCFGGSWRRRVGELFTYLLAAAASFAPWLLKNELLTGNPVFPLVNGYFHAYPPGWGEKENEQWEHGHTLQESEREIGTRLLALWRHVPVDAEQRFGPIIILLALGGLLWRRIARIDMLLLTMLVIQVFLWLFATHLYARFTVPFLIPLGLMAGRATLSGSVRRHTWIVGGVLLAGGAWNFAFAKNLNARESPGGAPASLIYDGTLPGMEYFAAVNHELPENSRILMIGDARAFYYQRRVDYCVVFNRSPFVEVVESAMEPNDILQWLRNRGYTHVLAHWHEVARLRRTYGFSSTITPDLFDRLVRAGLSKIGEFRHPNAIGPWVDLFEVH